MSMAVPTLDGMYNMVICESHVVLLYAMMLHVAYLQQSNGALFGELCRRSENLTEPKTIHTPTAYVTTSVNTWW